MTWTTSTVYSRRSTYLKIASNFKATWSCEFYYGQDGGIEFLKKLVTHTEKTHSCG
jgi:hypothetical protein